MAFALMQMNPKRRSSDCLVSVILQRRVYFWECLNTFAVRDLERISDFGSRPITLGWNSGAHGDQRPSSELGERLAEQPLFDLRRVS